MKNGRPSSGKSIAPALGSNRELSISLYDESDSRGWAAALKRAFAAAPSFSHRTDPPSHPRPRSPSPAAASRESAESPAREAPAKILDAFEEATGEAPGFLHLNDSDGDLGSNRD